MANKNLNAAKKAKNDEFYTQMEDIEKECFKYKDQFRDKVIFCNCDDARESKFFTYFSLNFEFFGLKKIIATGYKENGNGVICIYEGDKNGNLMPDKEEIRVIELKGNGDFRSPECIELLKEADIVVTNPPFSLFREYVAQLIEYNKKFLIIGNKNAVKYKEIFPLIKDGKIWLGRTIPNDFRIANNEITTSLRGLCRWYTNLETKKYNDIYTLTKAYKPEDYPKYDNYDAINVDKIKDIPYDYEGAMGVPITIIDRVCSDGFIHFETPIVDKTKVGVFNIVGMGDGKYKIKDVKNNPKISDKTAGTIKNEEVVINSRAIYSRVIIQLVKD